MWYGNENETFDDFNIISRESTHCNTVSETLASSCFNLDFTEKSNNTNSELC